MIVVIILLGLLLLVLEALILNGILKSKGNHTYFAVIKNEVKESLDFDTALFVSTLTFVLFILVCPVINIFVGTAINITLFLKGLE